MNALIYLQTAFQYWASDKMDWLGAGSPAILSLLCLIWIVYRKEAMDRRYLLLLPIISASGYLFGSFEGYDFHVFSLLALIWMGLAIARKIPALQVLPLTFVSVLVPDLYAAGHQLFWHPQAFNGIGGGGLLDGDFLAPVGFQLSVFPLRYIVDRNPGACTRILNAVWKPNRDQAARHP